FRHEQVKKLPEEAQKRIVLGDLDREYTSAEIAIITSAGPARALGLSRKGHLGVGADADVAIYPEKPDATGALFSYPRYVLKGGTIVVEEGDVRAVSDGVEIIVRPQYDAGVEDYLRPIFERIYTFSFDNYPTDLARLHHHDVVSAAAAKCLRSRSGSHPTSRSRRRRCRLTCWSRSRTRTFARCPSRSAGGSAASTISSRSTARPATRSRFAATSRA